MSWGSPTPEKCSRFSLDPAFAYLLGTAPQYAEICALHIVNHEGANDVVQSNQKKL